MFRSPYYIRETLTCSKKLTSMRLLKRLRPTPKMDLLLSYSDDYEYNYIEKEYNNLSDATDKMKEFENGFCYKCGHISLCEEKFTFDD